MKTKVKITKFKGHTVFGIYEVLDDDSKTELPIFCFGVRKSMLLGRHMSEFRAFLETYSKDRTLKSIYPSNEGES